MAKFVEIERVLVFKNTVDISSYQDYTSSTDNPRQMTDDEIVEYERNSELGEVIEALTFMDEDNLSMFTNVKIVDK